MRKVDFKKIIDFQKISPQEENLLEILIYAGESSQFFRHFTDILLMTEIVKNKNDLGNVLKDSPVVAFVFKEREEKERYKLFLHRDLINNQKLFLKYTWFVVLHELLHVRFSHLNRFKKLLKRNQMLTNIGLDIFINEIIKDISKGTKFEINERDEFYSKFCFIETVDKQTSRNVFGLKINSKKIGITKEMSDKDIVALLFATLENTFNKISNMISEAMKEVKNGGDNSNNNRGPEGKDSDKKNSSDNGNSNNVDSEGGDYESLKDYIEKVVEKVKEKFIKEFNENQEFKEGVEKASSVADIEKEIKREILERLFGGLDELGGESDDSDTLDKIKQFFKDNKDKLRGTEGSLYRDYIEPENKISISSINNVIAQIFNKADSLGYIKKSYKYPNKKIRSDKIILPRVDFEGLEVSLIVDTSGSMSNEELEKVFAFAKGLLSHGCELTIYFNDTQFEKRHVKTLSDLRKINRIKGGGGSVFKGVIEEAVKKHGFTILYSDLYIDTENINNRVVVVVPKENFNEAEYRKLNTLKFVI